MVVVISSRIKRKSFELVIVSMFAKFALPTTGLFGHFFLTVSPLNVSLHSILWLKFSLQYSCGSSMAGLLSAKKNVNKNFTVAIHPIYLGLKPC